MKDLKVDPNEVIKYIIRWFQIKSFILQVAEVFSIPLSFFFDAENVSYTRYRRNDHKGTYLTPVYKSTPKIWGITAVAVDLTLGILAPTQYTCITTDLRIKSTSVWNLFVVSFSSCVFIIALLFLNCKELIKRFLKIVFD